MGEWFGTAPYEGRGLQDCEKIRIPRQELKGAKLEKLSQTIAKFTPEGMAATRQSATEMVNELSKLLDTY